MNGGVIDRAGALRSLSQGVPYIRFLGIHFEERAGGLTAVMPFQEMMIGNPNIRALHGGVTAAFLEVSAIAGLSWSRLWTEGAGPGGMASALPPLARTVDFTVDYLRPGKAETAFARAEITRSGRRYASVLVEAWQDDPARPFAHGLGHFVMPDNGAKG